MTPKTEEILYRRVSVKDKGYPKESGYYDTDLGRILFNSKVPNLWTNTFGHKPEYWLEPYSDQQAGVRLPTEEEILDEAILNGDKHYGLHTNSRGIFILGFEECGRWLRSQLKPSQSQEGGEAVSHCVVCNKNCAYCDECLLKDDNTLS